MAEPSNPEKGRPDRPRCLRCATAFIAEEMSAATVRSLANETCVVRCSHCGAYNELRAEPMAGAGAPPRTQVLRVISGQK